jgi:hypothetical protein
VLAFANPDRITPADAEAAAERLRKPTSNSPGHYATGTGAVSDSLLACALPADDRTACIRMLLSNASGAPRVFVGAFVLVRTGFGCDATLSALARVK